jgi:hypothetical protein
MNEEQANYVSELRTRIADLEAVLAPLVCESSGIIECVCERMGLNKDTCTRHKAKVVLEKKD